MPSWVYALFECWLLFVFALCHGVWDGGPKFFFPWRIPTPHQCAKFQTTTIFSNLPTRVRRPKRVCVSRKTDEWYRSDSCAILSTNGAKSVYGGSFFDICPQLGRRCPQTWPKFTPCCGRFCDFELPPPNWPLNIIGLGTLIKTNFVWGIALHLGEIWGLKFSTGVYFGPDFPETPSSDFGIFGPSTAAPSSRDAEHLGKIWRTELEKCSFKVGTPTEYFSVLADFARSSSAPFGLPPLDSDNAKCVFGLFVHANLGRVMSRLYSLKWLAAKNVSELTHFRGLKHKTITHSINIH